ncbi:MAG: sigma 54-interacting transcriptional regulator [Terracidiphilus sp.]
MTAITAQADRLELPTAEFIFGSTAGMDKVREEIERAFCDDFPVLIEGESGTGKEVIGRFLHTGSIRGNGPFLKLNCAAVPPDLLGAEMFGWEQRGAVDARLTAVGSVRMASGGTLFLDEIGDMDSALLEKLMQTLESGNYRRPGGNEDLTANARFVCASGIDPETGLKSRTCVEKLLGLSNLHRVRLLPLRERKEDIPQLCEYLLGRFARNFGRSVPRLSSNALDAFQRWKWPGNIRELENWIARIVIFGAEDVIGPEFSRQLLAFEEAAARSGHVPHMKMGYARRLHRHR